MLYFLDLPLSEPFEVPLPEGGKHQQKKKEQQKNIETVHFNYTTLT